MGSRAGQNAKMGGPALCLGIVLLDPGFFTHRSADYAPIVSTSESMLHLMAPFHISVSRPRMLSSGSRHSSNVYFCPGHGWPVCQCSYCLSERCGRAEVHCTDEKIVSERNWTHSWVGFIFLEKSAKTIGKEEKMYIQQLTLATIIFVEKPLLKFKPMSCHSPVQSNLLPVQDRM